MPPTLILASESPRRRDLLSAITPDFVVRPSGAEDAGDAREPPEPFPPLYLAPGSQVPAEDNPALWAWRKARTVADQAMDIPDAVIVAADTIVVVDSTVLNKPLDAAEARAMLRRLAGRTHFVVTGWVLLRVNGRQTTDDRRQAAPTNFGRQDFHGYQVSTVEMRELTDEVIDWYVGTGEPLDKAGAYALQGQGGALVRSVDGCRTNVVGLPVCRLRLLLASAGLPIVLRPDWNMGCVGFYCRDTV